MKKGTHSRRLILSEWGIVRLVRDYNLVGTKLPSNMKNLQGRGEDRKQPVPQWEEICIYLSFDVQKL